MNSGDPRQSVLDEVAAELRGGPRARRRILRELADHIDDAVDDLRRSGVPEAEAIEEAVTRLGHADAIANAFADACTGTDRRALLRTRRSLAWVAVAAMSIVMACAAEVPQASGAKPRARVSPSGQRRPAPPDHPTIRHPVRLTPTLARPRPGHRGDRS